MRLNWSSIKPILPFAFVISLFLSFYIKANGDVIKLSSGDSISGKIIKQTDLYIVLDHNDLGQLDIPRNRIKLIDEQSIRAGMDIKRVMPDRRFGADFSYYNKVSDGSIMDNKFSSGIFA